MPILGRNERERFDIKIGEECRSITESYAGNYGPYWTTNTMTLSEAIDMYQFMKKEVALRGNTLCSDFIDIYKAKELFASQDINKVFCFQAFKLYEKIIALSYYSDKYRNEIDRNWRKFLTHFAILAET